MRLLLYSNLVCFLLLLFNGVSLQQESDAKATTSAQSVSTSTSQITTSSEPGTDSKDGTEKSPSMKDTSETTSTVNKAAGSIIQNDGDTNVPDGENTELSAPGVRDITADVQSANIERSLAEENTSPAPLGDNTANITQPTCNQRTHQGCDIINYERCTEFGTCECLRGYLKDVITEKCIAAQYFTGQIELANEYKEELSDKSSEAYRTLTSQLRRVLLEAFESQDVTGILHLDVVSIASNRVLVTFEVAVDKVNSGGRQYLQSQYNQGLTNIAHWDEAEGLVKLKGTNLVLGTNGSIALYIRPISETNHCVERQHNYCDLNARCTHSMRSFTCRCQDGYDDISPDKIRSPGELCTVECPCRNNGTCDAVGGSVVCRCPQWYIGGSCEINGKDLLIICVSVLGGLLVLTLLMCLVCICAVKNRKSSRSSTVGVGSLDTSVVKLPRVWMDGSRPYELPPRDTRRWSYVSEPIRYVDEYMMDDYVHAETLPLPRSHDAKKRFYPAYGNQAYSSSTLNIRPGSRH